VLGHRDTSADHNRNHLSQEPQPPPEPESPAPGPVEGLLSEETLLARFAETRDPTLREELVKRYLPLARGLAMRYGGGAEPSDDLIQVASLGLMGALDRYDPARGVPFPGFAGPTILGELRRHFRDRVWTLRVPRGLQERIRDVETAIAKLSSALERSPTVAEIAETLEIGEDEVLEAMEASGARRTMSLDQPTAGDETGDSSIGDRVGGEDAGYELVEERSAIEVGARVLSDLEREVLRLRFVEDLTQSAIAEQVGYSQMHVSRILRKALDRVRAAAEAGEP
jgi:RNA polymerase sigma-B factor